MIRVYFASKLEEAERWRTLCARFPHFQAHARWLKHCKLETPDTAEHAADFWLQDEQDVRDADAVVVFGMGDQKLRGALVEAGIAIACGVPVIVVGDHPDYSTWQHHPGVHRMATLDAAIKFLSSLQPRYRNIARGR